MWRAGAFQVCIIFVTFLAILGSRRLHMKLSELPHSQTKSANSTTDKPVVSGEILSGAEILCRALKTEGTEFVFGYPGGAVLAIYDEIYKQDGFKHILVRHEQAAVHAADAYARATGRAGVALVTSGPGVTNAVTGIATAYMDSIPMVIITGQVPTYAIGQDAFQECDTVGITRPCVKHNFLVKDVADLAITLKKAFYIATTGRPGPVVVDIPKMCRWRKRRITILNQSKCVPIDRLPKGIAGKFAKQCKCCLMPSVRCSTSVVARFWATHRPKSQSWSGS